MPKPLTEKITALFSSMRLAVLLLIILAAVSVIGTFIPQAQDPQIYIQRYGEETYGRLKLFGFIDLYHSWGFRALVAMLGYDSSDELLGIKSTSEIYAHAGERDQVVVEIVVLVQVLLVEVVVVTVVLVAVVVEEPERQGLAVDARQGVVVRLEGVGKHVVRVVDRRVVVRAPGAHRVEMGFQRGDQAVEGGSWLHGHGSTVAPRRAEWHSIHRAAGGDGWRSTRAGVRHATVGRHKGATTSTAS